MTQTQRVLEIIKVLLKGDEVCTCTIAERFDVTIKSIQGDMNHIKNFFKDSIYTTSRGCYKLSKDDKIKEMITDKTSFKELRSFFEFALLTNTCVLDFLELKEPKLLQMLKNDVKSIYHLKDREFEILANDKIINDLKIAIKQHRYIDLTYHENETIHIKNAKPIKILYEHNNWYLTAVTDHPESNSYKFFFRINYITGVKLSPTTFQTQYEALEFINNHQSLFSSYMAPTYKVKILVKKKIARYFRSKKYLKSQVIEEEIDEGLIVSYEVSDDMEIILLVKKWLPLIKVISPKSLDDKIKALCRTYLER